MKTHYRYYFLAVFSLMMVCLGCEFQTTGAKRQKKPKELPSVLLKTLVDEKVLSGHTKRINNLAFSHSGDKLLTVSYDKTARIWNVLDGSLLAQLDHDAELLYGEFNADDTKVLIKPLNHDVSIWNALSHKLVLKQKTNGAFWAFFDPKDRGFITSDSKLAILWNSDNGKKILALNSNVPQSTGAHVPPANFSPDGEKIAYATKPTNLTVSSAKVFNAIDGRLLFDLGQSDSAIYYMQFSPDSKMILTMSVDKDVKLWDASTGKFLRTISEEKTVREEFEFFSPDSKRIILSFADGAAKIFDVATGTELFRLHSVDDEIEYAAFSDEGKRIVTKTKNKHVSLWDASSGDRLFDFDEGADLVFHPKFSPDGKIMATIIGQTVKLRFFGE